MEKEKNSPFTHKNTQAGADKHLLTKLRGMYGFTGILNPHIMFLISVKCLTPTDKMVFLFVIQQTIGWNKLTTYYNTEKWSELLGINKGMILTSLNKLEKFGVIQRSTKRTDTKSNGMLRFHPLHTLWKFDEVDININLINSVIAEKHRISKEDTTKEDTTKDEGDTDGETIDDLLRDFG